MQHESAEPGQPQPLPLWLRLAQKEIQFRLEAGRAGDETSWDREHQMLLTLRTTYPDVPIGLAIKFTDRLRAEDFTWEAWDKAVAWLEETKWFKRRRAAKAA